MGVTWWLIVSPATVRQILGVTTLGVGAINTSTPRAAGTVFGIDLDRWS